MARRAKGWKLLRDPRTTIFFVRFTHAGRRFNLSTGESDSGPAAGQAARLYTDVVSGRWAPRRTAAPGPARAFDEVAAEWLADIESTVSADTFKLYEGIYIGAHFAPFFKTIDRLTTVGVEDYKAARLRVVTRETLKKELPVLRRFGKWAVRRGHLQAMPEIETPSQHVVGTRSTKNRKRAGEQQSQRRDVPRRPQAARDDRPLSTTAEAGRRRGARGSRCRRGIPVAFRSQGPFAALPGESGQPEKHQRFRSCARTGTRTPMDVIH